MSTSLHPAVHLLTNVDRDPQRLRTDTELISVLQRAWLLPRDGTKDPVAEAKFSLDSNVGDEGTPSPDAVQLRLVDSMYS